MKAVRRVGRRSFLFAVGGASVFGAAGCATQAPQDQQWDPLDNAAPRDRGRVRTGQEAPPTRCSDGDTGPQSDPRNNGRRCRPR